MRRVALAALCAGTTLVSGCGSSSDPSSTAATAPAATTAAAPAASAPSPTEAKVFVETRAVPQYRAALRKRGAGTFGDTTVECAATGGPRTECRVSIPYMRLSECAVASGTVMVTDNGDGPQGSGGSLDSAGQVCYLGKDGQPTPSKP
jgi:hypothetical protein